MLMFISAPVDDWNSNTELAFPDDGECGQGRGDRGSICNRLLVRLLLPIQTLQRGRTDRHQRALPQLHVSQPDAHVLPKVSLPPSITRSCHHDVFQGLSVHQTSWEELCGGEARGPVLPHHLLSSRSVPVHCCVCLCLLVTHDPACSES